MYVVVQVRGVVNTRREIKDTLHMLRLHHINHCVLVPDTPAYLGMIRKVKDFVAYGEVDENTLSTILETRGRLTGNVRLSNSYVKDNSEFESIEEFAHALCANEATMADVPGLKPVLRLHPPRKGHKSIKRTFQQGGALGYHGNAINDLIYKMR
jgi:large subunit ribosomal protein L30